LERAAREGGIQREVRRTFKMLREIWLNIGVEKIDMHKGIMIKALLDSGTTGMFIDRQTAEKHGFKLQKLERLLAVRNVDSTSNSGGAIIHQVECNVYYKGHIERMKIVDDKEDWGREKKIEKDHRKIEEMVPKKFLKWRKVFGKVESERMLMRKIWDHAIDLKETFKPRKGKIYPLSKNEREEIQNFVFVGKKDSDKRMVMDYHNLNSQTMKNNYPLLLITELIDNMGSKKVFTKMDLRWGFNNIRIKEGDEWKGAFTIHIGSFEPIIMFFGMTNSLATFQAMMNKILRDLINEGKVAAFVDNVLVGMEMEEGHDEIVKEILRKLEENDLYIKPEKCV